MKDETGNIKKASLTFNDFSITECQWKHIGSDLNGELDIKIIPSGTVDLMSKSFELFLDCTITISDLFETHLIIKGEFGFEEFSDEGRRLCVLNAPALLFPHARAYISALTSLSGLTTIVIPAMNLSGLSAQLDGRLKVNS